MNMDKHSGFTLVEIIVSMVVFALIVIGLSSVFISASKLIVHNRERMTSAQLGKFFLDPLQADVRYDTWDQSSNELRVGSRSGAGQTINNRNFSEAHVVSIVSGTDLRRAVSTISWTEPTS